MTDTELSLLEFGDIEIEGRLWDSSNSAVRVVCRQGGEVIRAVYKPQRGERPLWDFPSGTLGLREVATAEVDRMLGWDIVPATVWRDDGPLGPGSLQSWIDTDATRAPVDVVDARRCTPPWIVVAEGEGAHGDHVCLAHEDTGDLRRVALLDSVVNNADRKGGHVLRSVTGAVVGIDHGLTFHAEPKLRTVLWGWAGTPIDARDHHDLTRLDAKWPQLRERLEVLVSRAEIAAARDRLRALIDAGEYPQPEGAWPALPWPAM